MDAEAPAPAPMAAAVAAQDLSGTWELQQTTGAEGFLKACGKWDKKKGPLLAKAMEMTKNTQRAEYTQSRNLIKARAYKKESWTNEPECTVDGQVLYGEPTDGGVRPWTRSSWDEEGWLEQITLSADGAGMRVRIGMRDANTLVKLQEAYDVEKDEPVPESTLTRTYTRQGPPREGEIPRVPLESFEDSPLSRGSSLKDEADALLAETEAELAAREASAANAKEQQSVADPEATPEEASAAVDKEAKEGTPAPDPPAQASKTKPKKQQGLLRRLGLPLVWVAALLWLWQIVRTKRIAPPPAVAA